jgi:hypothetical protein
MATFLELQNRLAAMLGAEDISELPASDQILVKDCLFTALRVCYMDVDGRRAKWTEREIGVKFQAPVNYTLSMVKGSKSFTGASIATDLVGSLLKIGADFYTVSGASSIVEPYRGGTGSTAATLYNSNVALPSNVTAVGGFPELLGFGPLAPFSGKEQEQRFRSSVTADFYSEHPYYTYVRVSGAVSNGMSFEIAKPIFFLVEHNSYDINGNPNPRLHVYPIPDTDYSVKLTVNVAPAEITDGSATFPMPHDSTLDILLPIARAELVSVSRRYNGPDRELIISHASEARARLRNFTHPQKRRNLRLVPLYND